jgi:hypothetical protein
MYHRLGSVELGRRLSESINNDITCQGIAILLVRQAKNYIKRNRFIGLLEACFEGTTRTQFKDEMAIDLVTTCGLTSIYYIAKLRDKTGLYEALRYAVFCRNEFESQLTSFDESIVYHPVTKLPLKLGKLTEEQYDDIYKIVTEVNTNKPPVAGKQCPICSIVLCIVCYDQVAACPHCRALIPK